MKYYIPLKKGEPSQRIVVDIGTDSFSLTTRQMGGRQYLSIDRNGETVCQNVLLTDREWVVKARYLFDGGDFMPVDTQGNENPTYHGWGERFFLVFDTQPVYEEDYV